jgi:hypothetical protein
MVDMPDTGASRKRQICGQAKFQLKISGLHTVYSPPSQA